ncbi:hypothetical protein OIU34_13785 [Pararhizobium sp. BT-229]|uniref:hypothetical protein n=1 Tax=Pararhizobium sp. BT-229 TaxID=2986923 RepID=UPI0021F707A2|nr:hypothetical protein [Pararhizobium sp. BT-229]MCV9962974.1 hypothetical protein [Pararhizobium sp. BT-229]
MRAFIFALTLFCAVLSGWTASLARVQELGGATTIHQAGMGHGASAHSGQDQCKADAKDCNRHAQPVHPLLCAACFAVVLDTHGLDREELPASTIRPRLQKPMRAIALEPQFPPPKTSLSIA